MGTNNEGDIHEYKPHVKSKPNKLIIINHTKKRKHMGKANITNKDVQTTLAQNQTTNKTHMGKANKTQIKQICSN